MVTKIIFGSVIIFFGTVIFTNAQTVDDITNRNIDAMGGKQKMQTLYTFRMSGSYKDKDGAGNLVVTFKHLIGSRVDYLRNGKRTAQVVLPSGGWWLTFTNDTVSNARKMPEERFKTSQKELDIQGHFINYRDKGTAIELKGKEMVDSIDCYVLMATFSSGNVTNYYIDSKFYRVYKRSTSIIIDGERLDNFTKYFNYKQNEDGFWFPYSSAEKSGRITNFDKIETNISVNDNIFTLK